jgi:hypothetical protein
MGLISARDAATTATRLDTAIAVRLKQLATTFDRIDKRTLYAHGQTDPALRICIRARLKVNWTTVWLLAAGWTPALVGPDEVRWLPPPGVKQRTTTLRARALNPDFAARLYYTERGLLGERGDAHAPGEQGSGDRAAT